MMTLKDLPEWFLKSNHALPILNDFDDDFHDYGGPVEELLMKLNKQPDAYLAIIKYPSAYVYSLFYSSADIVEYLVHAVRSGFEVCFVIYNGKPIKFQLDLAIFLEPNKETKATVYKNG